MENSAAIEVALEAYRKPHGLRISRRAPLPDGMLTLIRIAGSSDEELKELVSEDTFKSLPIRDAAVFYLQQLLTSAETDCRQLALDVDCNIQQVKDHKRWLLKWLHPDRNHNSWESALFQRVSAAAVRLESALRAGVPLQQSLNQGRRRGDKPGQWQIAQRRVARSIGWKPRIIKMTIATVLFVLVVVIAQMGLFLMQGVQLSAGFSGLAAASVGTSL